MGGTFLYEHTPEATTNITGMMIVTAAMLIVQPAE